MKPTYPSDISLEQFERIRPILEQARKKTRPRTVALHHVFCGVLYVLKSGCQWRMVPKDFPKWRTCYEYFHQWSAERESQLSLLEEALKKCGWRGPARPWAERENNFSHR
jgi:transposase